LLRAIGYAPTTQSGDEKLKYNLYYGTCMEDILRGREVPD
jgi:hypothetical protein